MNASPAAVLIAALAACAGLWWFVFVLKEMKRLAPITRYGVYMLIWLAYFILTLVIARQMV